MANKLPLKPKNKRYNLTEAELRCLRIVVAFGEDKKDMYARIVRTDMLNSPAVLKKYSDQFYNSTNVRNFMADYAKLLDGVKEEREAEVQAEPKTPEEKAAHAVGNFKGKVYDAMIDAKGLDELETAAKLGDRVGAFDNEKAAEIAPQRYIPESCFRCRYKIFCEQNIKDGNIIDCCQYCVALEYAKERGFVYDPTKLLDLPFTEYTEVNKGDSDENN